MAQPDVVVIVSLQGPPGAPGALFTEDTGVANAIAVTIPRVLTAVTAGLCLLAKIGATNTGATTVDVNGLGALPLISAGAPLAAGVLSAGRMALIAFDGADWQLLAVS